MSDVVYLDGVDADALGLSLTGLPNAWSAPATPYDSVALPGLDGAILTRATPSVAARVLDLEGLVRSDTAAQAETALQALKDAVGGRLVGIRYGYQPERSYFGVLQSFEAGLFAPGNLAGWASVRMSFFLPDPWALDDTPTLRTGAATERVPVELGTGPTWAVVQVVGSATAPVVTYRDASGAVLGTATLSGNLTATQSLVLDGVERQAWQIDGATATSAIGLLASGYAFPVFSPRDGDRGASAWPTVETSSGTLQVTYARRWA